MLRVSSNGESHSVTPCRLESLPSTNTKQLRDSLREINTLPPPCVTSTKGLYSGKFFLLPSVEIIGAAPTDEEKPYECVTLELEHNESPALHARVEYNPGELTMPVTIWDLSDLPENDEGRPGRVCKGIYVKVRGFSDVLIDGNCALVMDYYGMPETLTHHYHCASKFGSSVKILVSRGEPLFEMDAFWNLLKCFEIPRNLRCKVVLCLESLAPLEKDLFCKLRAVNFLSLLEALDGPISIELMLQFKLMKSRVDDFLPWPDKSRPLVLRSEGGFELARIYWYGTRLVPCNHPLISPLSGGSGGEDTASLAPGPWWEICNWESETLQIKCVGHPAVHRPYLIANGLVNQLYGSDRYLDNAALGLPQLPGMLSKDESSLGMPSSIDMPPSIRDPPIRDPSTRDPARDPTRDPSREHGAMDSSDMHPESQNHHQKKLQKKMSSQSWGAANSTAVHSDYDVWHGVAREATADLPGGLRSGVLLRDNVRAAVQLPGRASPMGSGSSPTTGNNSSPTLSKKPAATAHSLPTSCEMRSAGDMAASAENVKPQSPTKAARLADGEQSVSAFEDESSMSTPGAGPQEGLQVLASEESTPPLPAAETGGSASAVPSAVSSLEDGAMAKKLRFIEEPKNLARCQQWLERAPLQNRAAIACDLYPEVRLPPLYGCGFHLTVGFDGAHNAFRIRETYPAESAEFTGLPPILRNVTYSKSPAFGGSSPATCPVDVVNAVWVRIPPAEREASAPRTPENSRGKSQAAAATPPSGALVNLLDKAATYFGLRRGGCVGVPASAKEVDVASAEDSADLQTNNESYSDALSYDSSSLRISHGGDPGDASSSAARSASPTSAHPAGAALAPPPPLVNSSGGHQSPPPLPHGGATPGGSRQEGLAPKFQHHSGGDGDDIIAVKTSISIGIGIGSTEAEAKSPVQPHAEPSVGSPPAAVTNHAKAAERRPVNTLTGTGTPPRNEIGGRSDGCGLRHGWPLRFGDVVRIGLSEFSIKRFNEGSAGLQGCRVRMEDEEVCIPDLGLSRVLPISFYGVYDGHGGRECAAFLRNDLHISFSHQVGILSGCMDEASSVEKTVFEALYRAFVLTDRAFLKDQLANNVRSGPGGAAVVCAIIGSQLWCANSGDARCVLSVGGRALQLSVDHKPDRVDERKRIEAAGGYVRNRRVLGRLAVSRAFGDIEYKNIGERSSAALVVADPEIRYHTLTENDEFIILACDGLFDVWSSQDLVDHLRKTLQSGQRDAQAITEHLVLDAIERRQSQDNVSATLILLREDFTPGNSPG